MFNLMAVVPDKRIGCRRNLASLQTNWENLSKELKLVQKHNISLFLHSPYYNQLSPWRHCLVDLWYD